MYVFEYLQACENTYSVPGGCGDGGVCVFNLNKYVTIELTVYSYFLF